MCKKGGMFLMKIEEVKVEDLVPYDNNPRKNAASVQTVAASIKAFGFKVPIVIDERNVIVAGHTRLMAAKELGLKKVPCVVASDLNEDQIKAFRLADNKVGETSSWDWDKLEEELAGMEIAGIDMTDFGFDAASIPDDEVDHFFEQHESHSEKKQEKKTVTCPHCGEEFEVEA